MKRLLLGALFALFYLQAGLAQCADEANIFSFNFDNKTYEIVMETQTWEDAAACAVERGGYLVEIGSEAESDRMLDAILTDAEIPADYTQVFNAGGIAYVWTGGTDQAEEGTWIWDGDNDGEGVHFWTGEGANGEGDGVAEEDVFINWGGTTTGTPNEPDDYSSQDYAAIGLTGWPAGSTALGDVGEWNDIKGNSAIYYIIEYDSIVSGIGNTLQLESEIPAIYPNPTSHQLNVSARDLDHFDIYDISGRMLESFTTSPVSVGHLRKGLYLVRISAGGQTSTSKLYIE